MSPQEMESPRADAELEQPLRTVVIKRHTATDVTQLELQLNEIVYVLEKDVTGWWGGHKEGEDLTGWFPGFCVQPCPLPETSVIIEQESCCDKQDEPIRNSALETSVSSPSRRTHAVASPQRRSIIPSGSSSLNSGTVAPEVRQNDSRDQSALLQQKDQQCAQLGDEVAKLRRDKETLEEALRQAQRQSSMDREVCKEMECKIADAEKKLQSEAAERKATLIKCEQLETELRHKDEEVATLRRMSVVSTMTQSMTPQPAVVPLHSPLQQANDEGPRRRLFPSTTTIPNTSELNSTNFAVSPSPAPVASSGSNANVRETSVTRARRSEEEPPAGYVKQLRNAFEARSVTPQRAQSRTKSRNDDSLNSLRPRAWNSNTTAVPAKGGSLQMPRHVGNGFSSGLVVSTETSAEVVDYGMSPINSKSKKDLKKSLAQASM